MNKKLTFLFAILLTTSVLTAQKNVLNISGQVGTVMNSNQDRKFGLGGSVAWLVQDQFISKSEKNYLSLTFKAFNNPYEEGKLISSVFNEANDGFNYVAALAGYRVGFQSISNGFYIEPRVGMGLFASRKKSFVIAPAIGYTYKNIDFGAFCDMGFSNSNYATLTNRFFTVGLSVGYNIGL